MNVFCSLEDVRRYFCEDPFFESLGVEIESWDRECAVLRLSVRDCHRNRVGVVHGGVLYSLCDCAAAVVANSCGRVALTAEVDIRYCRPVVGGEIRALAKVADVDGRVTVVDVEVTGAGGESVAFAKAVFVVPKNG